MGKSGTVRKRSQRLRQGVVWLHVVSSLGWMGQALAMCALLVSALLTADPEIRESAVSMAHFLDLRLLAVLANVSAFTGFMLSASTQWGFFRHSWVLAKFVLTVVQLYAGIFVLSGTLEDAAVAAERGVAPPVALAVGTGLMVGALAFQSWLSVAKPGRRISLPGKAGTVKLTAAPNGWFLGALLAPVGDVVITVVLGFPSPFVCLIVLLARLVARRRETCAGARPVAVPVPA